jgi:predicted O-linked N-acetylglucosamine transferase (SPINDLY family)
MPMDPQTAEDRFKRALDAQINNQDQLAVEIYEDLLDNFPGRSSVLVNLSAAYLKQKKTDKVGRIIQSLQALPISNAQLNAGTYFFNQGDNEQALAHFQKAHLLAPDDTEVLRSISFCLTELQRPSDAAKYAECLFNISGSAEDSGRARYYYAMACDWDNEERFNERESRYPFFDISRNLSETYNQRSAIHYVSAKLNYPKTEKHLGAARDTETRIRLAYLCGEFREHATLKLLISQLEHHDRSRFKVYYLDNGLPDSSTYRDRLLQSGGEVVEIKHLSDSEVISLVGDLQIDVLVNLNGFFGAGRNEVFFRRAAPVQVSYLGYPSTMGHPNIDYIIADQIVIPSENKQYYTEQVEYLLGCYQPNDALRPLPTPASRARFGLPDKSFIFCCLNNTYKITSEMFSTWMDIIEKCPGSILLLLNDNQDAVRNLTASAAHRGFQERVVFSPRRPTTEYIELLSCCDLFLDTFPYNAHTTGSDALWAALPILTLKGETFPSRVGASLISRAPLDDSLFITNSLQNYRANAIKLYENAEEIRNAKHLLKEAVNSGGFVNMREFTAGFEKTIENIYHKAKQT